jgi:hypothetical protein
MENQALICRLGDVPSSDLLTHPDEVISDSERSEFEKRAILADWASDARAVEDAPALRQLDNGAFVRVDDVLKALRRLDNAAGHMSFSATPRRFALRRRAPTASRIFKNDPDDEGPPPCAAGASIPPRLIYTTAKAAPLSAAA